jgi:predicted MFS family arabinose efflux permease
VVAASMTPAAFAAAAALARPDRVGRAIGTVASGMTVALVAGVPLATWLGAAAGWRATFWLVAGLAAAGYAAVLVFLPALAAGRPVRLARRIRLLAAPPVLLAVAATAVAATGSFMTYTYVAPIARDLAGVGAEAVALLIAGVGIAGALGTVLGGRATDRWGAGRTLVVTLAVQVAATAGLAATGSLRGAAPLLVVVLGYAVWGLAGWAFNPPMNVRLLGLAGDAGTEAVALNTSALYVGVAAAGALGGVVLEVEGVPAVLLTATAIGTSALVLLGVSVVRHRTAQPRDDVAAVSEDRAG